jgi:D-arginine dehydrogenase
MRACQKGLNLVETAEFLVIGGGIAGACAADALSPLGRVILAERETAYGYHTTGRSAALYTPTYGNAVIRAITAASRDFFYNPPDGFSDHPLVSRRPTLTFALPEDWQALQDLLPDYHRTSPEIELTDEKGALELAPILRPGRIAGGLIDPVTADIDVNGIHQGFLKRARRQGAVTKLDSEILSAVKTSAGFRVETKSGTIEVANIVNAAGAWGDKIAELFGVKPVGLVPKRRSAFTFAGPAGADLTHWPVVMEGMDRFYIKPDAGMLLGSPCDATPSEPMDAWPEDMDVAEGVERIEEATTLSITRLAHSWAGLRTFAPDNSPVVGMAPDCPSFIWFVGQGGYGIQSAPGMGRVLHGLIQDGTIPADIAALGVKKDDLAADRFA